MGLWQACPETDCPGALLSQVLFLIPLCFNSQPFSRAPEEIGPENKEASPCVCVFVSLVANVCHASLWSTTVTFSLSLHHELPYTPQSPYLQCSVLVHKASPDTHSHTHSVVLPSHWAETTGFGNQSNLSLLWFHTKFILLFIPFFTSFLHLFTESQLETGPHLHLYGEMYCIDKNNRRIFISCRFFRC